MKKYKVTVYTGLAWLKECGTFESFDEAQDKLMSECESYVSGCEDEESKRYAYEAFMFDSRIEEVTQ
jgi:hypothetical protein